jgi:branched-chain amino acid transport system permease protein
MDPMVTGNLSVGGISISYAALITILVSVAAMLLLTFLVQGTKLGKAMRAVSEDMGAAQLMGSNIKKTISFTFDGGSALAGNGSAPTPRPAPPWAPCWA